MAQQRKSLNKSIALGSALFIALLALVLCLAAWWTHRESLYQRYEAQMTDILTYTSSHIDHDDLARCARTNTRSAAYDELQAFMDDIFANNDIKRLYLNLNDRESTAEEFRTVAQRGELTFIEKQTGDGAVYTGALPLRDSSGDVYALLCVDLSLEKIHAVLLRDTIIPLGITILLGILFVQIFYRWIRKNVTDPIIELEECVARFAQKSHGDTDPMLLVYDEPDIHTGNEIESLSHATAQMAADMQRYALRMSEAKDLVETMMGRVQRMDRLAFQDSMTKLKNKASYRRALCVLDQDILAGQAAFAIVMVDVNYLKRINDTLGHERGDDYLIGVARTVCDAFKHSPVFRIGGDEFVAILEGVDYDARVKLVQQLRAQLQKTEHDEDLPMWQRFSAAVGMATYAQGDANAEEVFRHADADMYEEKLRMKAMRSE